MRVVYFNSFFGKVTAAVIDSKLQKRIQLILYGAIWLPVKIKYKACKRIFDDKHVYDFSPSKSRQ